MEDKKDFYKIVEKICLGDSRYKADAYEFMMQGLHFTQSKIKRKGHITGRELLQGLREFAIAQYGPMVKAVLNHWGIHKTQDFGHIVFNMVEEKLLAKTDTDSLDDFKDIYNFDTVFANVLSDSLKDICCDKG
ncbi:MAG: Minf_1886 family protein [Candidatus Omnitrophota bacterium]